jgi:hypothetical protein
MNMPLGKIEKRKQLRHLVEDRARVDVCVVAETRFIKGRGEYLMNEIFKEDYSWFGKEREQRKARGGKGGVGILIRNDIGRSREIKRSKKSDTIWIEVKMEEETLIIGGVYWSPEDNQDGPEELLQEIGEDIGSFKLLGRVIVMGDFNRRIRDAPTVYSLNSSKLVFPRKSEDIKVSEDEKRKGKKKIVKKQGRMFLETMNANDMFIMNGLDSGSQYTFEGKKGASVIDYIILCRELVNIAYEELEEKELEEEDLREKTPNQIITEFTDSNAGIHYRPGTMKVWNDWIDVVSDHRLVTCEMTCRIERKAKEKEKEEWKTQMWRRNDNGDPKFWEPLKEEVENQFKDWRIDEEAKHDANSLSTQFLDTLNDVARKTLGISHLGPTRRKKIKWKRQLSKILVKERKAYNNWKCGRKEERQHWKTAYRIIAKEKRSKVRKLEKELEHELIVDIEQTRTKNPKEYWKKLYRLAGVKKKKNTLPEQSRDPNHQLVRGEESLENWAVAFQELGTEDLNENFDQSFKERIEQEQENLEEEEMKEEREYNLPFTLEEIRMAIETLKRGKAAGVDGMINEILMYGGDDLEMALHKFFNKLWEMEEFPTEWSKGLISPIFKGGSEEDKLNPMKYRGITLLSVIGKLFTCVLKNRLEYWCEGNNILDDEQAGFRRARSTIDHIFTLHEVIMTRRPKRTYCCFIDIQKAYDRVWRKGLWKKLYDYGIRGKMWRMIKNIYQNVESCVQVNGRRSRFFPINVGLRQGCVLSPLLFDLFINGLIEEIKKSDLGVSYGQEKIAILMFADDIVLTAENAEELQQLMDLTQNYSERWRFKFNHIKSAVVIFRHHRTTAETSREWRLGNELVAELDSYKYLGIEFDKGLTFMELKSRLADKARKNKTIACNMGLLKARLTAKAGVNTWTSVVRPSLEYGAQVWGEKKWEPAEVIEREMGRKILRCPSQTTSAAVQGELGWWTMLARRDLLKLRYWIHLLLTEDTRLIKRVYKHSKHIYQTTKRNNWAKIIHELTKKYNLSHLWDDETMIMTIPEDYTGEIKEYWWHTIWMNIQSVETKKWKEEIAKKPKLHYYQRIKEELEMENYLLEEKNAYHRKLFTLFRVGAYPLRIETGRWSQEEKEYRFCLKCMNGEVEDEPHFLFKCEAYDVPRRELYKSLKKERLGWKPEQTREEKNWSLLMTGKKMSICRAIIQFMKTAINIRNQL